MNDLYSTETSNTSKPELLVISSTYPRWEDDSEPGFVHSLCMRIKSDFSITVITPHAPGSATSQILEGVNVHRFRYAPAAIETLVSNGGILANTKRSPLKWLLVPFLIICMAWVTVRAIKNLKPDVIHCHWLIPQGVVLWICSFFVDLPPVLATSHGGDLFSFRGRLGTFLKRKAIETSSAISVVSNAMVDNALKLGARRDTLHVAPMGAGFSQVIDDEQKFNRIPARILFVGRLVEKKGLIHLFQAMNSIRKSLPSTTLLIAGDGPERASLEKEAKLLGLEECISFLGAVPHDRLPELYQSASLFCAPFIEANSGDIEGLGLVTIEAMMFRCPILIGNVPAARDVLPPRYLTEHMVDPKNHHNLSSRVVSLLTEPPSKRALDEMKAHVVSRFSWETASVAYVKILSGLIARNRNRL